MAKGIQPDELATLKVGDTVYSRYKAEPFVIARISKSGQLAFGNGPFTSSDYIPAYRFTTSEKEAIDEALDGARDQLDYGRERVRKREEKNKVTEALIASLEHRQLMFRTDI